MQSPRGAVIRVYDDAGNLIETHISQAISKSLEAEPRYSVKLT
jgi:YD repeat-containing protein